MCKHTDVCTFSAVQCKTKEKRSQKEMIKVTLDNLKMPSFICLTCLRPCPCPVYSDRLRKLGI